jgi:hypothetical protein
MKIIKNYVDFKFMKFLYKIILKMQILLISSLYNYSLIFFFVESVHCLQTLLFVILIFVQDIRINYIYP